MRKLWIVIVLMMFAPVTQAQTPGADEIGDPYFPGLGNGGYDAQHYTLDLTVDMDTNVIDAVTTMEAVALQDLSDFNLDFIGFEISAISVNEAEAEFARRGRELQITPEEPLAEGDTFTVAVSYSGIPNEGRTDQRSFSLGWNRYEAGVYVASEPNGSARWFPVNDHPRDKATFTFEVTVPEPYVVAANGLLQDTIREDGLTTYIWSTEHLMSSYLATVNIAEFVEQTSEGPDGLVIRNYFPARLADDASPVFERTGDMIAYFSEIFGPYPFEAYGVVVADTPLFFALETQTMSLFGSEIVPGALADIVSNWSMPEGVVAHELAHQWFGNSVTLTNWQDIWLNEGFATYASALWFEHTQGEEVFEDIMRGYYAAVEDQGFTPGDPGVNRLFGQGVYPQGAWTLHALRLRVGDEVFFDILRTYAQRFQYGNATTADFIDVAEEISGLNLVPLFRAWLYLGDVPPVPEWGLGMN